MNFGKRDTFVSYVQVRMISANLAFSKRIELSILIAQFPCEKVMYVEQHGAVP